VVVTGGPPPSGRAALVKIGAPVHVGSSGPKTVKVTVPVGTAAGAGLPVTKAVSEIGLPTVTAGVASVSTLAPPTNRVTTVVSFGALQGLATGA
jgi:hypothetical protein